MKKPFLIIILTACSPYILHSAATSSESIRYPHGKMISEQFVFDVDMQALQECWTGYRQFPGIYTAPQDLLVYPEEKAICDVAKIGSLHQRKKALQDLLEKAQAEQWDAYLIEFINKKLQEKSLIGTIKSRLKRPKAKSF
jgi:hypothetical protein